MFVLKELVVPIIAGGASGAMITLLGKRLEQHHAISIAILPSDNAVERSEGSDFPLDLITLPDPTPTPPPNPRFTYAIILRNDGDFSEEHVAIAIGFHNDAPIRTPLSGPDITSSSRLLAQTVKQINPGAETREYGLTMLRLNPGEWVSLQASWDQLMEVSVQVRSDDFSASAFQ